MKPSRRSRKQKLKELGNLVAERMNNGHALTEMTNFLHNQQTHSKKSTDVKILYVVNTYIMFLSINLTISYLIHQK